LVTDFPGGVVDWASWHKWRKLPLASPAALLMHYPLSVYWLVTHVLCVTPTSGGSVSARERLCIHYLGAEVELNFIPIFSELALLLPYTDIMICFYGIAVQDLVLKAQKADGASIAARGVSLENSIYSYRAPKSLGGGSIDVRFSTEEQWIHDQLIHLPAELQPDAVVGPNAGLLSYRSWQAVIASTHMHDIPFAVTEYAEQSAEMQTSQIPSMLSHFDQVITKANLPYTEEQMERMRRKRIYSIELNSFQRPGQRQIPPTRLPNVPNGFTIEVVGKGQSVYDEYDLD